MSQQDLDNADVHASLEHVRGKAVAERVWPEFVIQAALASCFMESKSRCRVGQVGKGSVTGEEPLLAVVRLPDLSKHVQDRLGQRENPFLVSLADQAENHLFRIHRRDRQRDRLGNSQSIGVDQCEATAIDWLLQSGDQAATICIATDIGQPLLTWLAYFFLVNNGQS